MRRKPIIPANVITIVRMCGTAALVFFPPFSTEFLIIYGLTGLTDVLDGWVARSTGTTSELGARLDSIADLLFYGVMLLKLFPTLWRMLPPALWIVVAVALLLRLCAYGTAALKYHRFAAVHTYLNKLTGAAVFFVPYMLYFRVGDAYCWGVAVVALIASGEELLIHLFNRRYDTSVKSVLSLLVQ